MRVTAEASGFQNLPAEVIREHSIQKPVRKPQAVNWRTDGRMKRLKGIEW